MVIWHVLMSHNLVMSHDRMDLCVTRSFVAIEAPIVVRRRVPMSFVDRFMRCVSWHVLVDFMRALMHNNRLVHRFVNYGTVVLNRLINCNSLVHRLVNNGMVGLNRLLNSNSLVHRLVDYGTVVLDGVLSMIVACIMMDHRSLNMLNFMTMGVNAKLTILLNLVVNIQITDVSRLIQLAISLLNLTNFALMLQNLAPLLS